MHRQEHSHSIGANSSLAADGQAHLAPKSRHMQFKGPRELTRRGERGMHCNDRHPVQQRTSQRCCQNDEVLAWELAASCRRRTVPCAPLPCRLDGEVCGLGPGDVLHTRHPDGSVGQACDSARYFFTNTLPPMILLAGRPLTMASRANCCPHEGQCRSPLVKSSAMRSCQHLTSWPLPFLWYCGGRGVA